MTPNNKTKKNWFSGQNTPFKEYPKHYTIVLQYENQQAVVAAKLRHLGVIYSHHHPPLLFIKHLHFSSMYRTYPQVPIWFDLTLKAARQTTYLTSVKFFQHRYVLPSTKAWSILQSTYTRGKETLLRHRLVFPNNLCSLTNLRCHSFSDFTSLCILLRLAKPSDLSRSAEAGRHNHMGSFGSSGRRGWETMQ